MNKLPLCSRRAIHRKSKDDPGVIYCKPSLAKLRLLPPTEAITKSELFRNQIVTDAICLECLEREEKFPVSGSVSVPVSVPVEMHSPTASQRPQENTIASSLADIEATLPPYKEGRDRKLTVELDGTIIYEQGGEPPLDINGYQRDPNNAFRFTPLWPECHLRHTIGIRYAKCGCINVIMRCNNPDAPQFVDRVKYEQCQACEVRT